MGGTKRLLILFLAFQVFAALFSDAADAGWANTYGGAGYEWAYSVQQTSDGGYIVAGGTDSFGTGHTDVWVMKLKSDGTAAWQKTYGSAGYYDWAYSIQQTSDGGYILTGGTYSYSAGNAKLLVMKLNSDGTAAWQKTYGGSGDEWGFSIQQTFDGGYIVAGGTNSFGAGGSDAWILKLKSDGTIAWQKTYGSAGYDSAYSIQQTLDRGYIVAGGTNFYGTGDYDSWILKLNSDGTVAWQKTYGSAGYDSAYSIQQTLDRGYIVAGGTDFYGTGDYDSWILKLNSDGTVAWQKTYGGAGYDWTYSVQQTFDGGYIVAGETDSFGAGGSDVWAMKLKSDGTVAWQKTYGGAGYDSAYSIQQTTDGGYIVAGGTDSSNTGNYDLWVSKLDTNGDVAGCLLIGTSSAVVGNTTVTGINTRALETVTTASPAAVSVAITNSGVNPTQICCPPAKAVIRFDTVSKDIKVYDSGTGSEVGYVVVQSKSSKSNKEHKDDDDDNGDDDKGSWEKRKYTLSDCTGNALVLILKHKKEGKEAKVKVVSMQYGSAAEIKAEDNEMQAVYSEERSGSIKELEQKIYVKNKFDVSAKYKSSNNKTEIKVKLEGQGEKNETKSGMVILEMLTNNGSLTYRY